MNKLIVSASLLLVTSSAAAAPTSSTEAAPASTDASDIELPANVEHQAEPDTLATAGGFLRHSGWYLAPTLGVTTVQGHATDLPGIRGAWLINRTWGIGLAANVLGTWGREDVTTTRGDARLMEGVYGGLLLQYIVASNRLIHGFVDATIGAGGVCLEAPGERRYSCDFPTRFFIFEPTANVELNATSFMRVGVGAGYRFAAAENDSPIASADLGGFVARTTISFGRF